MSIIESYINSSDWRVKENSNTTYSFSGLVLHLATTEMAKYMLKEVYPKEVAEAHKTGAIHVHDLGFISSYCMGWSLENLLLNGLKLDFNVGNKAISAPPKHLSSAINQMVNFLGVVQMENAGAQAFNSVDTYLAPFVKVDKLTYKEIKQEIQSMIYHLNYPSRWGCVTEDVEILTKEGWKKYNEIEVGDLVATFNIYSKKLEYQPVLRVNVYDYDGELIELKNRKLNILVTPNHRVVRQKFNSNEFVIDLAKELYGYDTPISIPLAAEYDNGEEQESDDFIKLVAWILAEGSIPNSSERITIYQSDKNICYCEEIREILRNCNINWYEKKSKSGFGSDYDCNVFVLSRPASREIKKKIQKNKLPQCIKNTTLRQKRIFIETYIKADGYIETNGTNLKREKIYVKDTSFKNEIVQLLTEIGYGTTANKTPNDVWRITIYKTPLATITKKNKVYYRGKVWCPTVPNGTFVARRDETVFITGNSQSPFTNFTLDIICPEDKRNYPVIVGGKQMDFTYGDCQKEMDMINMAILEVLEEGDASGKMFTFPIITYNITKDFSWDSSVAEKMYQVVAKNGFPYFANFVNSDMKPSDIRSMCCRLRLDKRELIKRGGGLFGAGDQTGAIGVVTINLPQIGYLANTEKEYFDLLDERLEIGLKCHEIKRKLLEENLERGLYPYTKQYIGHFNNHFSVFGIIGMHESLLNFMGMSLDTKEGKEFALRVLDYINNRLAEFQERTSNVLYSLEATPAEGASYRLAKEDLKRYPDIITSGTKTNPYYTNSVHLPVNYSSNIFEVLDIQDELQTKFTGGTVIHLYIGEKINDYRVVKNLIYKVCSSYKLPYFSITPTFSICSDHKYISGEHFICPICGKDCLVYSRVVGYYSAVQNWNRGKRQEFKERVYYDI